MKVFEPFKLGNLELKNRMVVSAMVTNYCSPDGNATEKFIAYHEHKARGGWGPDHYRGLCSNAYGRRLCQASGDSGKTGQIESHRELTERVHQSRRKDRSSDLSCRKRDQQCSDGSAAGGPLSGKRAKYA